MKMIEIKTITVKLFNNYRLNKKKREKKENE